MSTSSISKFPFKSHFSSKFRFNIVSVHSFRSKTRSLPRSIFSKCPSGQSLEVKASIDQRIEAGIEDGSQEQGILKFKKKQKKCFN